jgi:hypothetical protein
MPRRLTLFLTLVDLLTTTISLTTSLLFFSFLIGIFFGIWSPLIVDTSLLFSVNFFLNSSNVANEYRGLNISLADVFKKVYVLFDASEEEELFLEVEILAGVSLVFLRRCTNRWL